MANHGFDLDQKNYQVKSRADFGDVNSRVTERENGEYELRRKKIEIAEFLWETQIFLIYVIVYLEVFGNNMT